MNKKKGMSLEWVLLPILFTSATVLAGSDMTGYAPEDPCMNCPSVMPDTPLPDMPLMDEPPMSGDYVRRGGVAASAQVRQVASAQVQSAAVQAQALGQESDGFLDDAESISSGNMNYVGGNTRIGIGIDTEFKGRADLSHVFSETEDSATSGQGWLGINPKADKDKGEETVTGAGVKLNHHWVTTDGGGQPDFVNKVFGAYDQNAAKDKKITAGYGQERENLFWSGHVSKSLSDKRESGEKTADGKVIYEKAYDMGVGGRVGTFMDDQLMRIQGGLDYEWGTEKADAEKRAAQLTVSGGVEKFFEDSPHSIGANVEVASEQGGYVGDEHKTDVRGNVNYRYDFGGEGLFAADQKYRRVRVEIPGKTIVTKKAPKVERKLVKHTMELEADTFFEVGKFQLTAEAQQSLRTIIARIRQSGHEGNIRITGNTCDSGSTQANQILSERRAAAVRDFLAANGFNPGALLAQGQGELRPKYPNTDATRHKNRRVDIEYVTYETKYQDQMAQGGEVRTQTPSTVVWRKELIPSPPSWVGQALRNNIQYKQTIDTYRTLGADMAAPVGNTNVAPVANNDTQTTMVGTVVTINVLQNDTDANGDTLTIESFTQPAHGSVSLVNGMLVYAPTAGYVGADSFTYTVIDGRGGSATATVNVTVGAAANTNPVAVSETVGTKQDTAATINVLANDTDADGDTLSILGSDDNSTQGGTVVVVNGSIVYTPAKGFTGTDTFNYTISDGRGGTSTATVTVQVAAASMAPAGDYYKIDPANLDANGQIQLNVLVNDVYIGVAQGIRIITHPSNGSIANVDGSGNVSNPFVMYQPKAGVVGTDSFVYALVDGAGNLSPHATVTIELSGTASSGMTLVDDGADGKDSYYNFTYDDFSNPVTPRTLPVLDNDIGTGLTIIGVSKPRFGSAAISSDGQSIVYTPRDGYCESHTLTYTVRDKNGNEGTATVFINIE